MEMGDVADDILDGDMCELCGEWLGDGDSYPRKCESCEKDSQH
jgi:hypothetical protein